MHTKAGSNGKPGRFSFTKIQFIMKTLNLTLPVRIKIIRVMRFAILIGFFTLIWRIFPLLLLKVDATAGLVDGAIWQLLLFSILAYLILLAISTAVFSAFIKQAGLPSIQFLVTQFKDLNTWQQLGFYWASFALLVLAGIGTLAAVI